jgi:4-hydroxybenzoate polyprenyltransferase
MKPKVDRMILMGLNAYPILSAGFWKSFFITMRPYLLFVSGSSGLVGLAFIESPQTWRLILAFIPFFLSYGLGQALTDCFQIDTDTFSSPYRPLVRGTISPRQVISISLSGLFAGMLILGFLNPVILVFGALAVAGLLTYTPLKRTWWGGPPWNSWIVALLPIMGRLVDRTFEVGMIFDFNSSKHRALLLAVLAIFFAYANFVIMGYFKDISADKKAGYCTFPVAFGWLPTLIYSDAIALLAAFLTGSVIFIMGDPLNIIGVLIFIIAVGVNLFAQIKIHRTRSEEMAHGPISHVVRAFILYCASMVVTLACDWLIFLTGFYILFEFSLKIRPEKKQV